MDISVDIETFANNLSELVSILAMAKGIQVQQWTAQTYFNSVGWCAYFHEAAIAFAKHGKSNLLADKLAHLKKANPTLTFDLTMDTVVNAPTLLNEYLLTNPMTPNSIPRLNYLAEIATKNFVATSAMREPKERYATIGKILRKQGLQLYSDLSSNHHARRMWFENLEDAYRLTDESFPFLSTITSELLRWDDVKDGQLASDHVLVPYESQEQFHRDVLEVIWDSIKQRNFIKCTSLKYAHDLVLLILTEHESVSGSFACQKIIPWLMEFIVRLKKKKSDLEGPKVNLMRNIEGFEMTQPQAQIQEQLRYAASIIANLLKRKETVHGRQLRSACFHFMQVFKITESMIYSMAQINV